MVRDASGRVEEILRTIQSGRVAQGAEPSILSFSDVLGRRVRTGDWDDQKVSTMEKIRQALGAGDFKRAAEFGDFFVDEANVIFEGIYRDWVNDLNEFMLQRGVTEQDLRAINERILALLSLPDGRPFHARLLWEEFRSQVREFIVLCGEQRAQEALKLAEGFKESWRQIHDRDVDHIYGLINEVVVRFGESALEDMWDHIIGGLFNWRYAKFDIDRFPWEESLQTNLYLAFEAMRGHLVGPGREGNMEFEEDEERYTFRFDPCGSGGHTLRGDDEVEGTPPRMEPPYNWGVTQEEHDFAWNKKGVCYYCIDCCVVMQLKPIEAFGYPVRVVEPPTYPANTRAKCTWHVYKDPTKVPERYYEDVGREKPKEFGSGTTPASA